MAEESSEKEEETPRDMKKEKQKKEKAESSQREKSVVSPSRKSGSVAGSLSPRKLKAGSRYGGAMLTQ